MTLFLSLFSDLSAKQFWCKQIKVLILKFADQALQSATEDIDDGESQEKDQILQRVSDYRNDYENRVQDLLNK